MTAVLIRVLASITVADFASAMQKFESLRATYITQYRIQHSDGRMPQYLSDSPIETPDDDRYGVSAFAKSIAKSISNLSKPVGTVIALNGAWGSGKSSIVNLIRAEIGAVQTDQAPEAKKLVVTEFKCWWFRGEEALQLGSLPVRANYRAWSRLLAKLLRAGLHFRRGGDARKRPLG
jgi:hypothetical protein